MGSAEMTLKERHIESHARTVTCPRCGAQPGKSCGGAGATPFACTGRVRLAYKGRRDAPKWLGKMR